MATKAMKTPAVVPPKTTALTTWDDELAKYAQGAVEQEKNTLFGNMFGTRAGVLTYQGTPIPGNVMDVVIMDFIHRKAWFKDKFDADNPSGPHCYALSRDGLAMRPDDRCFEKQNETCDTCAFNQMGSADTGRGKACREARRLACVAAGDEKKTLTASEVSAAEIGYLETPPTSIVPFAQYVKGLANTARRPPFSVITRVRLVPDQQTQFKLEFELVKPLTQDVVKAIMARRASVESEIFFPFMAPRSEDDRKKKPAAKPVNPVAKTNSAKPAVKTAPPPAPKTTKSGARVSKF